MFPSLLVGRSPRSVLLAFTGAVLALLLAACGGTTGEETSGGDAGSGGGDKPLVRDVARPAGPSGTSGLYRREEQPVQQVGRPGHLVAGPVMSRSTSSPGPRRVGLTRLGVAGVQRGRSRPGGRRPLARESAAVRPN